MLIFSSHTPLFRANWSDHLTARSGNIPGSYTTWKSALFFESGPICLVGTGGWHSASRPDVGGEKKNLGKRWRFRCEGKQGHILRPVCYSAMCSVLTLQATCLVSVEYHRN